ncbi:Zn(II)2Cys6 transcription factor domain-containing protein [Aspergillus mulundensis]|uniref:Zn(2)-C6 fungal-type domain-containing protein n=1 Tax=Aspergillus mulundensis TaxID=1810919 RepID=A0A3D8S562_9EURO|nr:Uncharacterized protein DSM5745_04975 [Aspergillus mulundensis]RDW81418.1 Uncharacterized protein DSM5745_04975 [Aspergillus mulundensis]
MSRTPSPKSSKLGPLHTRRGCKVCKIRKLKCDEQKPSCKRCLAAKFTCEYPLHLTASYASAPSITTSSVLDLDLDVSLSSPPSNGGVWSERRAFAYYFHHAAPYLAGGLDQAFWTVTVPRICRLEPAVWDAVNAISALFEFPDICGDFVFLRSRDEPRMNEKQSEALGWYSRSLSKIQSGIERRSVDVHVALVSCVLFVCIEMVQGRVEEALGLYGQGVRLILDLRARGASVRDVGFLEDTIVPLFIRLGTAALSISGVPICDLYSGFDAQRSYLFRSLEDARDTLIPLAAEVQIFQRDTGRNPFIGVEPVISPEVLARCVRLQGRLDAWRSAYAALTETLSLHSKPGSASSSASHSSTSTITISVSISAILQTYHATITTILATCLSPTACIYDRHLESYRTIINQASLALECSRKPDGAQPIFTFELGVGLPLFWTALTCRQPQIRREALRLLHMAPPMQGFSKTQIGIALAGRIMQLEEKFAKELLSGEVSPLYESALLTPPSEDNDESEMDLLDTRVPEEARIQHYAVFRPCDQPHILGPHGPEVAKWGRSPDQLFLRFTRNRWDAAAGGWVLSDELAPMD